MFSISPVEWRLKKQARAQTDMWLSEKDEKPTGFWMWKLCTTNGTAQFSFLLIEHKKKTN